MSPRSQRGDDQQSQKGNVVIHSTTIYIGNAYINNENPAADDRASRKSEITKMTAERPDTNHSQKNVVPAADMVEGRYKGPIREGIVGLANNSLYCYMNALLQCLLPIEELRDYYLTKTYERFGETRTVSKSFEYSDGLHDFFRTVFKYDAADRSWQNPTALKNLIRRKFVPTMQHDSHEFFTHVMSML